MAETVNNTSCYCMRCRLSSITGPVFLITLGVLFLVDEFAHFSFWHRTWPILLIVVGVVKILQVNAPAAGHVEPRQIEAPPPSSAAADRQV